MARIHAYLSTCLSICLFTHQSNYLFVCLSDYPFMRNLQICGCGEQATWKCTLSVQAMQERNLTNQLLAGNSVRPSVMASVETKLNPRHASARFVRCLPDTTSCNGTPDQIAIFAFTIYPISQIIILSVCT